MTSLRARHADRTLTVPARPGATLGEALAPTGLKVRTGCNGNGSCGLCRVRILSGPVSAPTDPERLNLAPALLAAGVRLACQTVPLGDVELEVENLAPGTVWRELPLELLDGPGPAGRPGPAGLRAALDIGTTHLNLTLWDPEGPRRLKVLRCLNPQAGFGSDVITRLQAASDPAVARQLASAVQHAVAAALQDATPEPAPPCAIVAVGNTAMLALLQGSHPDLLDPGAWDGPARSPWRDRTRWELGGERAADVTLVAPLGGFVGSDFLAAALACALLEGESPALLIDFGTNTEIALWDGASLWVTSASGGPAFEACGLRCAVPAEDGAISRVRPGTPFRFEVIGGGEPKGVCGTGLVDWVACLAESGVLTRRGTFNLPADAAAPALGGPAAGITLGKRDVDLFQRAKAAIGAGIQVLMDQAGVGCADLRRVVTTGLFGRGLDIPNAQAIGLIPPVPPGRVEAHHNLALSGCEALLLSADAARALAPLRERARLVNLARRPEFGDLFVQNLFLGPMEDA